MKITWLSLKIISASYSKNIRDNIEGSLLYKYGYSNQLS